jgi:hypothetical protein
MKTASSERKPELVFHFFADRESDSVLYTALQNWCGSLRIVGSALYSTPGDIWIIPHTADAVFLHLLCHCVLLVEREREREYE